LSGESFRHRVARRCAEFPLWSAVIDITGRPVKAMSRFGTEKGASISAPFERSCFERSEHRSTNTTKPCVRRYIVERDLARVSDRAHCKDTVVIDCHEHRIARLDNPRPNDLRGLIGEPSRQDLRVVPVIGPAQFGNRSPEHLASGRSIFGNGVADFYDARRIVFWRLTPFFPISNRTPVYQIRCPTIAPTVSLVDSR
jgi:hypothetical protein